MKEKQQESWQESMHEQQQGTRQVGMQEKYQVAWRESIQEMQQGTKHFSSSQAVPQLRQGYSAIYSNLVNGWCFGRIRLHRRQDVIQIDTESMLKKQQRSR